MSIETISYFGEGFTATHEQVFSALEPELNELDATEADVHVAFGEKYPNVVPVHADNSWTGQDAGWVFFAKSTFRGTGNEASLRSVGSATPEEILQLDRLGYEILGKAPEDFGVKVATVVY